MSAFTSSDIGQHCIAIVCFPGSEVTNFEIELIFLINQFLAFSCQKFTLVSAFKVKFRDSHPLGKYINKVRNLNVLICACIFGNVFSQLAKVNTIELKAWQLKQEKSPSLS